MSQLQMRMLRPAPVTAGTLTSNIPETGSEYSAGAVYAKGAIVVATAETGRKHRYESLVAGNHGNALTDAVKWLDRGATNRWAMFDDVNGTMTEGTAGIDVSVAIVGRADGLALLNLQAEQARVTMTVAGEVVYDHTRNLVSAQSITDWYAYFSEEIVYDRDLILTDLPLFTNPTIRVRIDSDSGDVAVGTMAVGMLRDLGMTLLGVGAGIQDFSRKERDAEFGTVKLIERDYAKRANYKLLVENSRVDGIFRLLSDYRAKVVVWIGSDQYAMTSIYGFAKDWAIEIAFPLESYVSLEIEGLT